MNDELSFDAAPFSSGLRSANAELEEERGGFRSRRPGPGRGPGAGAGGRAAPSRRGAPLQPRPQGPQRHGLRRPFPPGWRSRGAWLYPVGVWPGAVEAEPDDPERIRWVQHCLNRVMGARLRRDGSKNRPTRSLLRAFQRRSRLPVTGLVDAGTEAALRAACRGGGSGPSPAGATPPGPAFEPGDDAAPAADASADEPPPPDEPADSGAADGGGGDGQDEFADFVGRATGTVRKAWDSVTNVLGAVKTGRIIDLTGAADKTLRKGTRDPAKVHALVLHQMACCFKPKDPLKRFLSLNSHFAILSDGRILQLHPVSALLWASNGFNARSVAVEFAGNFPNAAGRWWQGDKFGRDRVTAAQLDAGRYLVGYLKRTIGLTHVLAHRQSSGTRDNDPGPDVWSQVGQWAVDTLGMKDGGPGFKIDHGSAIPDAWRTWGRRPASGAASREMSESETGELDARHAVELGEAGGSHTDAVRPVQRALNRLLGLRIPEDGMETPETRSAIRSFERRTGAPITGRVGPALVASLQRVLGTDLGRRGSDADRTAAALPQASESEWGLESETATQRVLSTLPTALGVSWQPTASLAAAARDASGPGVYVIFFPRGLTKQAYVGQTGDLGKRLKEHLWCLTHMGMTPANYRVHVAAIDDVTRRKAVEVYINSRLIPKGRVTNQKTSELEQELWGSTWQ